MNTKHTPEASGMTLKQFSIHRFYSLCCEYRQALMTGDKQKIVALSVAIHAAKANVPKQLARLAGQIFNETQREKRAAIAQATGETK